MTTAGTFASSTPMPPRARRCAGFGRPRGAPAIGMLAAGLAAGLALVAVGCGESPTPDASRGVSAQPAPWRLDQMPDGAIGVTQAKASAVEGDRVTVRGVIGGRRDALGDGIAVFVLVDADLPNPCTLEGEENCPTPWDYCCTPPERLRDAVASVQLVDPAGGVLAEDLAGQGLAPLDEVVVVGTVAARPSPQALTIRATGLYVVPRGADAGRP